MKINKIMLTLFILLAILTATAVSAAEDVENMTAQTPLEEVESSDMEKVTQTDEKEQLEEKTDFDNNRGEILGEVSEDVIANESSTDFDLNVSFPKTVYGNSPDRFGAYIPQGADGTLTLYINGEYVNNWTDFDWHGEDNYFDINLVNPKPTNTWKVEYAGDSSYSDTSENGTFEYKYLLIPEVTDLSGHFMVDFYNQGFLTFLIDDKQIFNDFYNGMVMVQFNDRTVGNHKYEIIMYDKSNQLIFDQKGTFYADYDFNPFVNENGYSLQDEIKIVVDVPEDATGEILVSYKGMNSTYELNGENVIVVLRDLELGSENITFTYTGDEKYPGKTVKDVISILGYQIVPHKEAGRSWISLTLPDGATGKLNISLTDYRQSFKTFLGSADFVDGTARYVLPLGNYYIWAEYNGTGYEVQELVEPFDVLPDLKFPPTVIMGEDITIDILASNASGVFKIFIGEDEIYNGTLDEILDGYYSKTLNVPEFKNLGDNFINVWYNGTMLNKENPYRFRFNVLPGTLFVPQEFGFDKSANMTLNLSEYANGNVSVIGVMDPDYQHEYVFARNVSVSGNAIVPLSAEKSGDYMLFIEYVDEQYGRYRIQTPVHVPNADAGSEVVIPQTVTSDTLDIALPKDATGSVLAIIDGNSYIYELVNGSTKIDLSGLSAGSHNIVLKYTGDENYERFEKTADFTIKKATFITAKPISVVYKNNAKWTINLKDADLKPVSGQTIKVTVNGKTYSAKTDAKGNPVVTIPANMVPKPYTAKIVFAGTALLEDDFENVNSQSKRQPLS